MPNNLDASPPASESQVNPSLAQPESGLRAAPEQMGELSGAAGLVPIQNPPLVDPIQPVTVPTPTTPLPPVAQDDSLTADDVDVIEKEWVNKAKRIVSATKDDPHNQEKEVSKLQADYLMKRYNKKVKLSE